MSDPAFKIRWETGEAFRAYGYVGEVPAYVFKVTNKIRCGLLSELPGTPRWTPCASVFEAKDKAEELLAEWKIKLEGKES